MRLVITILAVASLGFAAEKTTSAKDDLDKLLDKQDRAALEQSANSLHAAAAGKPADANAWYSAALAYSYAAEVSMELRDKAGSEKFARAGAKDAELAVNLNQNSAEYHRLLGTLYGQVIPANPLIGALSFGKKAKDELERAIALDPKSPRIWISHGVGFFYLPVNFGGGAENAIKDYRKAISLDPRSFEAYLWMGVAYKKDHQDREAREALQKSLELNPNHVWTKQQLGSLATTQ
jgi:tetratricopeptide (TPR) repeat protein